MGYIVRDCLRILNKKLEKLKLPLTWIMFVNCVLFFLENIVLDPILLSKL